VFQQKCREAITEEAKEILLEGEVEIDGGWFGGYIKPENVKINRRLAENRNGKRRVVVGARERGPEGRTIVAVFDGEDQARSWIVECVDRGAQLFADGAPAWDEISATHSVLTVNHDERYADGIINTNAMESFFSRLRQFEATHHHISGTYLHRYANDAAWRENNCKVDDRRRTTMVMRAAMKAPQSRSFSGYWQRESANHRDDIFGDVFSAFAWTISRKNDDFRQWPKLHSP
jgi:hypothetical protein